MPDVKHRARKNIAMEEERLSKLSAREQLKQTRNLGEGSKSKLRRAKTDRETDTYERGKMKRSGY